MLNTKLIGYAAAISATILLGSVGVFVRNIFSNGYMITFARLGVGFVFLTFYLFFKNEIRNIKLQQFSFSLFVSGILLAVTSLCYINAINSGSLATAVFLLYLGPLIAVGIAAVLLKEKLNFINGGLLCLAFLGFLFILEFKFSLDVAGSDGYLWGIGSALCYALYIIFNRQIPDEIPSLTRSFYQLLIGAVTMLPFLGSSILNVPAEDIFWLMAIGFFQGFLAFPLIILALKHLKAVQYGTISYIEPLVASLIGFSIYAEQLTLLQIIGCAIVFSGGMIQIMTSNSRG